MIYYETWICSLSNLNSDSANNFAFSYGFQFHYLDEKPSADEDMESPPTIFDIEVGRVPLKLAENIDQDYDDKEWIAKAFVAAINKPGVIIGFQVNNDAGDHFGERPSFEVLCADTACKDLIKAGQQGWVLSAIYEGDIEDPSFCREGGSDSIQIQTHP